MLEMLKMRKESLQERGVKGFTLMEMLIVIAIIAVLIAIAIPVLSGQLENAAEATDAANLRAAYATASVKALEEKTTVAAGAVKMTQNDKSSWQSFTNGETIGGQALPITGSGDSATIADEYWVQVDPNGSVTFETTKPSGSTVKLVDYVTGEPTT